MAKKPKALATPDLLRGASCIVPSEKPGTLVIESILPEGMTREQMHTMLTMMPTQRHALIVKGFVAGGHGDTVDYLEAGKLLAASSGKVRKGNLDELTDMLVAQAFTLDTMITEFSRRAMMNLGQHPGAVETYTNLALKAQANCRITVETLAKVKRGGKQVVKVIHVHEGGQAVVADTINQGGRRGMRAKNDGQPHGQLEVAAAHASIPALSGPDSSRNGVPLPSYEGQGSLQNPRRSISRRSKG